ncbi:hypothetical protein B0H15DRAFT_998607 [Mycena belliarum]|uniref:Uncharacterized protein n=1 Tax=Mycena belliarum TaxID=1033014 RepID=A0AAD6UEG4_9AGAR|nr:hypothetical protein B0H15DRAFT_998607 [Mycena belliae]
MVFRLPTHLDNFIPPPSTQGPTAAAVRPWRGTLTVRGMRSSDPGSNQEIRVTAVETDGDSDVRRWPPQFFAYLAHGQPILREVRAWIQQHAPPISTFMPDRLPDPDTNVVNQTTFRSLSRLLFEHQIVAVAHWGPDSAFSGGGLIIIPAEHSSALLVAALFFHQFPDVISTRLHIPQQPLPHAPTHPHPHSHPHSHSHSHLLQQQPHHAPSPYQHPHPSMSQYSPSTSASARGPFGHSHSHSPTAPTLSLRRGSLSPTEQPISRSRLEHNQFRAIMPRSPSGMHASQSHSPMHPSHSPLSASSASAYSHSPSSASASMHWPKDDDLNAPQQSQQQQQYAPFPPHAHYPPPPPSR